MIDLTDELLDRWTERLEHPDTQRTTGKLRDLENPDAMCCIGHLADIVDPNAWSTRRDALGMTCFGWRKSLSDSYTLVTQVILGALR